MSKRGRQQGELENQVMDALWSAEGSMTSQEILEKVNRDSDELALTTILTVLSRLVDKGMVTRSSGSGRSLDFRAAETRERHSANLMLKLLGDSENPALTFAQFTKSLSPKQLAALRETLEK
jgi:predicted transcriptional regulator